MGLAPWLITILLVAVTVARADVTRGNGFTESANAWPGQTLMYGAAVCNTDSLSLAVAGIATTERTQPGSEVNSVYYTDKFSSHSWAVSQGYQQWGARAFATCTVLDGVAYLIGGSCQSSTSCNEVTLGYAEVWSSKMTSGASFNIIYPRNGFDDDMMVDAAAAGWAGRHAHQTVAFNNELVLMGGSGANGATYNDIWTSSTGTKWAEVSISGSMWQARQGFQAVVFNSTLFVVGGLGNVNGEATVYNDVWTTSNLVDWVQVSTSAPFSGRFFHQISNHLGSLYLTGGCTASGQVASMRYGNFHDTWRSVDGVSWELVAEYSAWTSPTSPLGDIYGRCAHNSLVIDDVLYVTGGTWKPLITGAAFTEMYGDLWTSQYSLDCEFSTTTCNNNGKCVAPPYVDRQTRPNYCECTGDMAGIGCGDCKPGYFGASCTLCSGSSVSGSTVTVCHGHGACDGGGTQSGTGECMCEIGWDTASDCNSCAAGFQPAGVCEQCTAGHFGLQCSACQSCGSKVHAHCDGDGTRSGTGQCVCDHGWAGDNCDTCAPGFQAPACTSCEEGYGPPGQCNQCLPGYFGPSCSKCQTCPTHATCQGSGTMGGSGACVCDAGFAPPSCSACLPGFKAPLCNTCEEGYWGPSCTACPGLHVTGSTVSVCNGHGTCSGSGSSTGTGVCSCTGNTAGSDCSQCKPGFFGPTCESCPACVHGTCSGSGSQTGSGICHCEQRYNGTLCNECNGGWSGPDCDSCNYPHTGSNCDSCAGNHYGPSCTACPQCQNSGTCNGGGTAGGTGKCDCPAAYSGPSCASCSAKALLIFSTCKLCPLDASGVVCGGQGQCVKDSDHTQCNCNAPWYGFNCTLNYSHGSNSGSTSGSSSGDGPASKPPSDSKVPMIAGIAGGCLAFVAALYAFRRCTRVDKPRSGGESELNRPLVLPMSPRQNQQVPPQRPPKRSRPPPPPPPTASATPYNPHRNVPSTMYTPPPAAPGYTSAATSAAGYPSAPGYPSAAAQYPSAAAPAQPSVPWLQPGQAPQPGMGFGVGMGMGMSMGAAGATQSPTVPSRRQGASSGNPAQNYDNVIRTVGPDGSVYLASADSAAELVTAAGLEDAAPAPRREAAVEEDDAEVRKAIERSKLHEIKWEELSNMTKLGQGSFGIVHKARWRGTLVAVKVPMSQEEDISEEAVMLERVSNHPNVLSLVGMTYHPFQAMVLPFMEKGSMEDLLVLPGRRNVRATMPWKTVVRMLLEAASGILHLHKEGVIHRDLALRNLLVDSHDRVCVADFGMARAKQAARAEGFTRTLMGPIKWESPECLKRTPGQKPFSAQTDVFSFGVTMWEAIAGSAPWPDKSNIEAGKAVAAGHRMRTPAADAVMARLVEDCWAHDPEARPLMAQVVRRLSVHLDGGGVPAGTIAAVFGK